jgi:glycosyltransferase involved in cell wall biosynthesis
METKPIVLQTRLTGIPTSDNFQMGAAGSVNGTPRRRLAESSGLATGTQARTGKIALLGSYPPRQCGIATFTSDLRLALTTEFPECESFVVAVNDQEQSFNYPEEVRFSLNPSDLGAYQRAADFLNIQAADLVCVQHEFGIYGGPAGRNLLALLRELRSPIVTTLHTVLQDPDPQQEAVIRELIRLSSRLVVMTAHTERLLIERYGAPPDKVDRIAHGIPDTAWVAPALCKEPFAVEDRLVLLTFGLLSPGKGIEVALKALPEIVKRFPDVVYIVLGATHPHLVRDHGEAYRLSLESLAEDLGVSDHVIFYNRFVELAELTQFIAAADIYVTPYLNEAQAVSGTLAYAFGCGKPVVSTPYWHARELLDEGRGALVPFGDSQAIAEAVNSLLGSPTDREAMARQAYQIGRSMLWSRSAQHYGESFERALAGRYRSRAAAFATRPLAQRTGPYQRSTSAISSD